MTERKRIIVGVAGGIAAYKACELLRRFTESGHDVTVVPTAAALQFVGAATWAALSGKPVTTEVWTDVHEVPHVRLGQTADLVVVAPATPQDNYSLLRAALDCGDPVIYMEHKELWGLQGEVIEQKPSDITAALDEVTRLKQSSSKGRYIQKATVSTTFGPGIPVDVTTL